MKHYNIKEGASWVAAALSVSKVARAHLAQQVEGEIAVTHAMNR
jgi:hypothetical protein